MHNLKISQNITVNSIHWYFYFFNWEFKLVLNIQFLLAADEFLFVNNTYFWQKLAIFRPICWEIGNFFNFSALVGWEKWTSEVGTKVTLLHYFIYSQSKNNVSIHSASKQQVLANLAVFWPFWPFWHFYIFLQHFCRGKTVESVH